MEKNTILYIGNEQRLPFHSDEVEKDLNCKFEVVEYTDVFEELFDKILYINPSMIILEVDNVVNQTFGFLLLLKSHSKIKNTYLIIKFPNKDSSDQFSDIYSFGVDYAFLENEEKARVLNDLAIIISPAESDSLLFAKASMVLSGSK